MSKFRGRNQRMINQFRAQGLDHMDEPQVLELLLFFSECEGDTYLLAHELIHHFGSLRNVLTAPIEALEKVPGVNKQISSLLSLAAQISRYSLTQHGAESIQLRTSKACAEYISPCFASSRNEEVYLLCLDAAVNVICCRKMEEGTITAATVPMRKIVETALTVNAVSVVLAHNHPGGSPCPSADDIVVTKHLAAALDGVDIALADHIIFSNNDYISMAQLGYYRPDECRILV